MTRLSFRTRLTLLYTALIAVTGAVLLGVTLALAAATLPEDAVQGVPAVAAGPSFSGRAVPGNAPDVIEIRATVTGSLARTGGIALAVTVVVAAVSGWFLSERVLSPVRRITATARRVAVQDLSARIGLGGPDDDVKELADAFDVMLARLEQSFAAQSRFIANAAHELRTPVAGARTLAEVALARRGVGGDAVELAGKVRATALRQDRLITSLLVLAQSAETVDTTATVDLADVAGEVLRTLPAVGARIDVRADLQPASTGGDRTLLEQLTRNLVDNAFRYNDPGGWVSVRTTSAGGSVRLQVENCGAVVSPESAEQLFEPFRRLCLDQARRPQGSGLGLSVVRAIAGAHGGSVTAIPRQGGGLVVEVALPVRGSTSRRPGADRSLASLSP